MKYVLRVRAAARRDIIESQAWYAARSPAADDRFTMELDAVFSVIADNPLMYAKVYRDVRRALTRSFPYAVYFVVDEHRVSVLRVLHQARDPREWQSSS